MSISKSIASRLTAQKEDSRLSSLKNSLVSGVFAEQQKKQRRKTQEKKLYMLLKNALFLEEDKKRKKRWIDSIPSLENDLLERLINATIRENLRFKQHKRNLVIELNKKRAG